MKRYIYRPRPFIKAYSHVYTTIRYNETVWKSSCLEKPLFSDIFGRIRPLPVAKTVKRRIYRPSPSYEPIPRSLRPSVTKIQPGKKSMTDGRTDSESIGPKPLGLGPQKCLKQGSICETRTGPNRPPPQTRRGMGFADFKYI